MQRRYETIGGTNVTVEDHGGSGPTVILVHGLGGSAGNWGVVAPMLTDHARPVALDLPGHGRSGPARRHTLSVHVDAVIGVIERSAPGAVTLVGNSMGGLIGEMAAVRRPDLVAALVLLSPASPPADLRPADRAMAVRLVAGATPGVRTALGAFTARRTTPAELVDATLRAVMHDPGRLPADVLERAVALAELRRTLPWAGRAFTESAASVRNAIVGRRRHRALIGAITAPTTVVHGREDRVVPVSAIRRLAVHRPDWRFVELTETGHTPMLERPDVVAHEIIRRLPAMV